MDITDLLKRARSGDREALESLLTPQLGALAAFVRLRLQDVVARRESSADLVQSICRQVVQDIDSLRARDADGFRAWLFGVARNKLSDRHDFHFADKRDVRRDGVLMESRVDDDQVLGSLKGLTTPSRALAAREEIERIETAFDQLPVDWREALLLVGVAKLSYSDAAATMDRSEASVRQLLHRGRARLATLLDS